MGIGLLVAPAVGAALNERPAAEDTFQQDSDAAQRTSSPSAANPNGSGIAATCMTCHHPSNTHLPWTEQPSAAAIRAQAEASGTVMHRLVRGLTEAEIEAVAAALALAPEG